MRCDVCDTKIPPEQIGVQIVAIVLDTVQQRLIRRRHLQIIQSQKFLNQNVIKIFIYHVEKKHVIVLNEQKHLLLENTLFL